MNHFLTINFKQCKKLEHKMGCFITIFVQHKKITQRVIMVAKTCLGDRVIHIPGTYYFSGGDG